MKVQDVALIGLASGAVFAFTIKNKTANNETTLEERKVSWARAQTQVAAEPAAGGTAGEALKESKISPQIKITEPESKKNGAIRENSGPRGQERAHRQLMPPEIHSVTTFMREIKRAVGTKSAPADLFRELESLKLRPRKSTSVSETTGDLITIRAQESLPGVRYFHAQFVSDGDGTPPVAQHISFEIRPSADGMFVARKMAMEMFQLHSAPTIDTENYVEWNRNGRTLWIKKLTDIKELRSDLFNARNKNDLGLVMVALELDPHAHDKSQ